MKKHSLIRTIYLYIFALLGLILITIGSVQFVNMGLKIFIFKQADEQQRIWNTKPPEPYGRVAMETVQDDASLTEEERALVRTWLNDYEAWKERSEKVDRVTAERHRDASKNLSLILIGVPLYLFHWRIISRETRNKKKD